MPYVPTTITAISTDWGTYPRIVRITTLSDLAAITTNGYLITDREPFLFCHALSK